MEAPKLQKLSRRERQIMDILFEHGELSAKSVMESMHDPPGYATVRSLLRILEEKGYVKHHKVSRQFIYKPTLEPEKAKHKSLHQLLQTFFGGSISEAVATFINHPDSPLSQEELDDLEAIVKAARKNEPNS